MRLRTNLSVSVLSIEGHRFHPPSQIYILIECYLSLLTYNSHFRSFNPAYRRSASTCYDMEEAEAKEAKVETTQSVHASASWNELSINDIKDLARVADKIHPDLPESDEVFAERVELSPEGCLGLWEGKGSHNELCGYVISHPIKHRQPPALNSLLGKIASDADQYYIHDLAILPKFRRRGFAQDCIKRLVAIVAKRYATTCLIAVYGTEPFWRGFGFVRVHGDGVLGGKVREYGDDAVFLERKNEEYQRQATRDVGTV